MLYSNIELNMKLSSLKIFQKETPVFFLIQSWIYLYSGRRGGGQIGRFGAPLNFEIGTPPPIFTGKKGQFPSPPPPKNSSYGIRFPPVKTNSKSSNSNLSTPIGSTTPLTSSPTGSATPPPHGKQTSIFVLGIKYSGNSFVVLVDFYFSNFR